MKYGIIALISLIVLMGSDDALARVTTNVVTKVRIKAPFNKKHYSVIKDIVWAADKVEVPRSLMLALCWGEGWSAKAMGKNPTHIDGKGKNATLSHGICQVKLEAAEFMDYVYKLKIKASRERLEDNKINAYYAAKLISYQLRRYKGDWQLAVDAYNKGTAYSKDTDYVEHFEESLEFIKKQVGELANAKEYKHVDAYQTKQ